MKGINYITNYKKAIKALVIDMKVIEKHDEEVHELIDALVAESRKHEEKVDWDIAKKLIKSRRKR